MDYVKTAIELIQFILGEFERITAQQEALLKEIEAMKDEGRGPSEEEWVRLKDEAQSTLDRIKNWRA